jgi:hypothetical protein
MRTTGLIVAAMLVTPLVTGALQDTPVAYPAQYREWAHVKSTLIGPQNPGFATNGGLHHFYANEKGVEGYRSGTFPDGAVLVDDLVEMKDAASTPGVSIEGARKRLAVMVKDAKRFAATGGWGYEIFKGDMQTASLDAAGRAACQACHQKAKNAVYSEWRK